MSVYEFEVEYVYREYVEIEADSQEEAQELAEAKACSHSAADAISVSLVSCDEDD